MRIYKLQEHGKRLYYVDNQLPYGNKSKARLASLTYAWITLSEIEDIFGYAQREPMDSNTVADELRKNLESTINNAKIELN